MGLQHVGCSILHLGRFLKGQTLLKTLILGSCLQVDPSPHNYNSDPVPQSSPTTPPPIVKSNAFLVIVIINALSSSYRQYQCLYPPNPSKSMCFCFLIINALALSYCQFKCLHYWYPEYIVFFYTYSHR